MPKCESRHCRDERQVLRELEWAWPYRESDRLGGYDPYASSKACAELVTDAYRRSFFNYGRGGAKGPPVATVRAGNVIGGGDGLRIVWSRTASGRWPSAGQFNFVSLRLCVLGNTFWNPCPAI